MKFILGKKICMTQVFSPTGEVVPVTKVQAGPCQITQIKIGGNKQQSAVQLGFNEVKAFRLKKPQAGHLKDLRPVRVLHDFSVDKIGDWQRGDDVTVSTFDVGDVVEVIGISKGKGFAGVVKRHHFAGGPASHGHKDNLRAPGSIGAGGVQRVFKGMRMAGRMGGQQVTVKNLEIVQVNPSENEILVKGALPGGRNATVIIIGPGELKVEKKNSVETPVTETLVTETPTAEEIKVEENTENKDN
ncbi:MAG: 50S ribosomal protein L3 [Candidatus Magasanikbacteria bacterium CG10_big_fil_rev_8_21_14_0_10_36_32]|uniref:Large ribosomal subunit protein uL3 n=1 Tax=Candidatus Magasanikbacteria bacterium CG10_big_fil_rev_8_21_14_0_10_36_32 TaxID=1974646 RepID=A0A2M6W6P3_9BACT|nr:MAG: 50S ribosomal protein L3 [Candidatus Magasanikbacteria bacterium CG10_big_fil_rev_8_21_14_0_10_36_32]